MSIGAKGGYTTVALAAQERKPQSGDDRNQRRVAEGLLDTTHAQMAHFWHGTLRYSYRKCCAYNSSQLKGDEVSCRPAS